MHEFPFNIWVNIRYARQHSYIYIRVEINIIKILYEKKIALGHEIFTFFFFQQKVTRIFILTVDSFIWLDKVS